MTTPGWYPNYENEAQLRYHDGERWTEHVHATHTAAAEATAVEPPVQDTIDGPTLPETPPLVGNEPAWLQAILYPLLGIFAGLIVGGMAFNAVGAITPVTEQAGTVRSIDIEYSRSSSSSGSSQNRESHALSGTTETGENWKIYSEDAYNTLQREGYPQPVTVAIGDWTGTAERVTGASFEVNHQSAAGRIGWSLVSALLALGAIAIAWAIARHENGGVKPAVLFFVFMAGPGIWLGFQAFQWIQSG